LGELRQVVSPHGDEVPVLFLRSPLKRTVTACGGGADGCALRNMPHFVHGVDYEGFVCHSGGFYQRVIS